MFPELGIRLTYCAEIIFVVSVCAAGNEDREQGKSLQPKS
jgi:hypothetical protein